MRTALLLAVLGILTAVRAAEQAAPTNQTVSLETFERYQVQTFPDRWQVRGDEDTARTIYRVQEENGNRFRSPLTERK